MTKLPADKIPDDHRRCGRIFEGVTDDGLSFRLEVGTSRKHLTGNEMVKAQIKSMTRGRPLGSSDMYKEVTSIVLYVQNRHRTDIELLDNGAYRYGRHIDRSLRKLVIDLLDEMKPTQAFRP